MKIKNLAPCILLVASTLAVAGRKREPPPVDPRLREVRTVFVKGNNEAAIKAREKLEDWTCFSLALNEKKSDAVLDFDTQKSSHESILEKNAERSTVSATLTNQDGDILWSKSSSHDAGFVNSGAGSGAHDVLMYLNHAVFPQVDYGPRGVKHDACPAKP